CGCVTIGRDLLDLHQLLGLHAGVILRAPPVLIESRVEICTSVGSKCCRCTLAARWISSGNGSWNSARISSRVQLWRTWPTQALEKDNACARDIQFAPITIAIQAGYRRTIRRNDRTCRRSRRILGRRAIPRSPYGGEIGSSLIQVNPTCRLRV